MSLTNQENPLPTAKFTHALHTLVNGRHHDTSEHCAHLAGRSKKGSTLGDLVGLVPSSHDINSTGVGACFCKSKEEPNYAKLSDVLHSGADHLCEIGQYVCHHVFSGDLNTVRMAQTMTIEGNQMLGAIFWMTIPWGS